MAASVLEHGPIQLDRTIYPEECLLAATEAYRDFLHVERMREENGARTIEVTVNPAHAPQAPQVRKEFLNYLLDLAIRHHLMRP